MMKVKFIAHSGIAVSEDDHTIMIDPWFFSSDLKNPVLEGILPPNRTIDFQIPAPVDAIANFSPHAIFVSHFHTHHSPLREVRQLLRQRPGCRLAFPRLPAEKLDSLKANLGPNESGFELMGLENGSTVTVGPLKVTAMTHTCWHHLAYLIEGKEGRVLHLTDAKMNNTVHDKRLGVSWEPYKNLAPDILFIASGSHTTRGFVGDQPTLALETTLTPLEAARVTSWIAPKVACVFGLFNQSVWKNQSEFVLPSHVVEEQYAWALQHMSPSIRCLPIRPGFAFEVESRSRVRLNILET